MKNIFLLLTVLISACSTVTTFNETLYCESVDDCIPESCCHANSAVNVNYAPNCKDIACTQHCEPDTLDCQQKQIYCESNQCIVK